MSPRTLGSLACLVFSIASSSIATASDGNIRIFFEPGVCQGYIPCNSSRELYIYAVLEGATANGFTGVEYSLHLGVDGSSDPGWGFHETFAPNTVALGSGGFCPPDQLSITPRRNIGRGINVAWSECQTGVDGMVLIETVEVTNTGCGDAPLSLVIGSHDVPRNSFFRCPLATLCDGPVYTKVCLGDNVFGCENLDRNHSEPTWCSTSGSAVINPTLASGLRSPCLVTAIAPATWGHVKDLYR